MTQAATPPPVEEQQEAVLLHRLGERSSQLSPQLHSIRYVYTTRSSGS